MLAERPEPGELVYVERRGDSYTWCRAGVGTVVTGPDAGDPLPDAWVYYGGRWPDEPDRMPAFFDDLLAEMEAAAGGEDRCRWSLDDPWPHGH
ncbi:MAG: hypothetical protein GEV09_04930 [Pseudonocardiaceae bacterium]|nr:hypothetical protein [Pseudonocardiaceae bacterium]